MRLRRGGTAGDFRTRPSGEIVAVSSPQIGIFARGANSHYLLELDLRPGVTPAEALASLRRIEASDFVTGSVNVVIALGQHLLPVGQAEGLPATIPPFRAISG